MKTSQYHNLKERPSPEGVASQVGRVRTGRQGPQTSSSKKPSWMPLPGWSHWLAEDSEHPGCAPGFALPGTGLPGALQSL